MLSVSEFWMFDTFGIDIWRLWHLWCRFVDTCGADILILWRASTSTAKHHSTMAVNHRPRGDRRWWHGQPGSQKTSTLINLVGTWLPSKYNYKGRDRYELTLVQVRERNPWGQKSADSCHTAKCRKACCTLNQSNKLDGCPNTNRAPSGQSNLSLSGSIRRQSACELRATSDSSGIRLLLLLSIFGPPP